MARSGHATARPPVSRRTIGRASAAPRKRHRHRTGPSARCPPCLGAAARPHLRSVPSTATDFRPLGMRPAVGAATGGVAPAAVRRDRRARRRARITRATRGNTPTATHNHSLAPSARPRQPVIRCLSTHLVGLDLLSVDRARASSRPREGSGEPSRSERRRTPSPPRPDAPATRLGTGAGCRVRQTAPGGVMNNDHVSVAPRTRQRLRVRPGFVTCSSKIRTIVLRAMVFRTVGR